MSTCRAFLPLSTPLCLASARPATTPAELLRVDQFARLEVTTADGHQVDIDMGVDWREAEPAVLAIGLVLSLEDAVGNKLSALYSRANARDFSTSIRSAHPGSSPTPS
jgi:hypothetical protein